MCYQSWERIQAERCTPGIPVCLAEVGELPHALREVNIKSIVTGSSTSEIGTVNLNILYFLMRVFGDGDGLCISSFYILHFIYVNYTYIKYMYSYTYCCIYIYFIYVQYLY